MHTQLSSCKGDWCIIKAGTFLMGSPGAEKCREHCSPWVQAKYAKRPCRAENRETLHKVTLTRSFEIMRHEVTRQQFLSVTGTKPVLAGNARCPTCPVSVRWEESARYCNVLSERNGHAACYTCDGNGIDLMCEEKAPYRARGIYSCPGYRLPTEAEWEYAYRAGTDTAYHNGSIKGCVSDPGADQNGWYKNNSAHKIHPVMQKAPNGWGLYDMAGNVIEWCNDRHGMLSDLGASDAIDPGGLRSGRFRVIRGGSYSSEASRLRAAARDTMLVYDPAAKEIAYLGIGFRCARTLTP